MLATTIVSFTRWTLFPVVAVAAVLVAVTAVRRHERLLRVFVAIVLLVVAAWGYGANARGDKEYKAFRSVGLSQFATSFGYELRFNTLTRPGELSWFIAHGMPVPQGLKPYLRSSPSDDDYPGSLRSLRRISHDKVLVSWVETKGRGVYARYVVTHPGQVASRFLRELPYTIAPLRDQIVYTTKPRGVLPNAVESVLFSPQGNDIPTPAGLGDVGLLLAACVAFAFVPAETRRRSKTSRARSGGRRACTVGSRAGLGHGGRRARPARDSDERAAAAGVMDRALRAAGCRRPRSRRSLPPGG